MADALSSPQDLSPLAPPPAGVFARLQQPGPWQYGAIGLFLLLLSAGIVATLWWGQSPMAVLYSGLSEADGAAVVAALERQNVPVEVRGNTIRVPESQVHRLRLTLAGEGLPKGQVDGFELLKEQSPFGVSQFMEQARHQRALEGELARSVMSLAAIRAARVHLGLPKESVFVRDQRPATASVLVQLHPGRTLDRAQVTAITQLIAASVPGLQAHQVSVVDEVGRLLSQPQDGDGALQNQQLEHARQIERELVQRIEDLLTPIVGIGRVRAQVAADVDFTQTEETNEVYGRDGGALRSERTVEARNNPPAGQGIPGALTNQPPGPNAAPEQANPAQPNPGADAAQAAQAAANATLNRRESQRNFEVDRRIVHTKVAAGRVKRLTAAVLLDERTQLNAEGVATPQPFTADELARFQTLVSQAIGIDAQRGDTLALQTVAFAAPPFPVMAEPPLWEQAWFANVLRQVLVFVLLALVVLFVVRPVIQQVLARGQIAADDAQKSLPHDETASEEKSMLTDDRAAQEADSLAGLLLDDRLDDHADQLDVRRRQVHLARLEERLQTAKVLVAEDPKRAVQVLRHWLSEAS